MGDIPQSEPGAFEFILGSSRGGCENGLGAKDYAAMRRKARSEGDQMTERIVKPLLVGPFQSDARLALRSALHPDPPQSAGGRLCFLVMGLDRDTYLRAFDRVDLCCPKWILSIARGKAAQLLAERGPRDVLVLCGTKVATAFSLPLRPFTIYRGDGLPTLVVLPHPSGTSTEWLRPGSVERARAVLREAGVLPVGGLERVTSR